MSHKLTVGSTIDPHEKVDIFLIEKVLQELNTIKNNNETITLLERGVHYKVSFNDIFFIRASGMYSEFVCRDDKEKFKVITQYGNLGKFEELLEGTHFLKSHRSFLVNSHLIRGVKNERPGGIIYFDREGIIPTAYYAEWFKDWLTMNGFLK